MLCEYVFAPSGTSDEARRELDDWVGALLSRYRKNGQLWGDVVTGWVDGALRATFHVPTADALEPSNASKGVTAALAKVQGLCAGGPSWRVVGESSDTNAGVIDGAKALIVRADMFTNTSPVFEGGDGTPVPLFALSIDWNVREQLQAWMRRTQLHDELWINSGRLESAAYQELSMPDSALSAEGRELAKQLETATGIATYYFLKHYWGRRAEDQRDACPACGGAWAADKLGSGLGSELGSRLASGPQGIDGFALRCDACRIVSERATAASQDE